LSKVDNKKKLTAVCAASIALFFVAAILPVSAQAPVPPTIKNGRAPHVGGNTFLAPRDIIYLPTRPESDTLANMYFGDWRHAEPKVMFGSLVVRDILTQGNNFRPPFPGAVLEHAKFLSYGQLEPGAQTTPTTLQGVQVFFYIEDGEGEVSAGGRTESLHHGNALLVPQGLEFTLRNTGTTQLNAYMIGDPTFPGFKPLPSFVVKDEGNLPHHAPEEPSPFTNPGASGHWAHITHGFFNKNNGLATVGGIITVEILPMQMGEPHPHFYDHEEIWCEIKGKSLAFYGSQLRIQHAGEAYMLRPDNLTTHSNINFEEPGRPTIEFLWFSTNEHKISTVPH
jgi:mannose-6-phosphate isomerase-like protein (cupin superfamily)